MVVPFVRGYNAYRASGNPLDRSGSMGIIRVWGSLDPFGNLLSAGKNHLDIAMEGEPDLEVFLKAGC
jgi:hypothetical protein